MSLVDRWLSRHKTPTDAATFATTATSVRTSNVSAGTPVAGPPRHPATSLRTTAETMLMSRLVAIPGVDQNPKNSGNFDGMSQLSQLSQGSTHRTGGEPREARAATVWCDGNTPHAWAKAFAQLDPHQPPGDVLSPRWQTFINDFGSFLGGPFCALADKLGWGLLDLLGCDRDRPYARIDQAGLLWLLNGDRLVALSENTATIETRTGARQTWRRLPAEPTRALPWNLVS
jgi:hypothetical protein